MTAIKAAHRTKRQADSLGTVAFVLLWHGNTRDVGFNGVGDGGGKYATGVHGGGGWEGAGIGALLWGCNSIAAYGTGEMEEMEWIWLIDRGLERIEGGGATVSCAEKS